MRKQLKEIRDQRMRFQAEFERYGKKTGWRGAEERTVLLRNVKRCDTGQVVTDHLWFNLTKAFDALVLEPGDVIEFDARVQGYEKGYYGRRDDVYNLPSYDYKLSRPTRVQKVTP